MMRLILICVLAAGAVLGADLPISRRAPGFSLPDVSLKQHDLGDYQGKIVLLDFMRTDCPKCVELTPELEKIKAKYAKDVVVLSVVTPPDNQATVTQYILTKSVTGPVLFDCGQMTASYLQVGPSNPTVHLPRVFVVDRAGIIRRDLQDADALEAGKLMGIVDAMVKTPAKK
jgi:peroxiredoxin